MRKLLIALTTIGMLFSNFGSSLSVNAINSNNELEMTTEAVNENNESENLERNVKNTQEVAKENDEAMNKDIETVTITFDANGGELVEGESEIIMNKGERLYLSQLPEVEKEGYSFEQEWYLSEEGPLANEPDRWMFDSPQNEDLTVYASFSTKLDEELSSPDLTAEDDVFYVTYDANGAEGVAPLDENAYEDNSKAIVLSPLDKKNQVNLQKKNDGFSGWDTQADGEGTRYQPGEEISVNKNITLFAQWDSNENVGDILLILEDGATDNVYLADGVFSLLDSEGNAVRSNVKTSLLGRYLFDGITEGEYTLVQNEAPESYAKSVSINLEVTKNLTTQVNVFNEPVAKMFAPLSKGNFQLTNATPKEKYDIYDVQGNRVKTLKIDLEGSSKDVELKVGTYTVVSKSRATKEQEILIEKDYKTTLIIDDENFLDTNNEFTSRTNFENKKEPRAPEVTTIERTKSTKNNMGYLDFTKYYTEIHNGKERAFGLEGAEFEFINLDTGKSLGKYFSDDSGMITFANTIPAGNYRVVELSAPEGFKMIIDESVKEFTIYPSRTESIDMKNEKLEDIPNMPAVLNKRNNSDSTPLEGAEFSILTSDKKTVVKSGLVTNENGQIIVTDLPVGSYHWLETKAPFGFEPFTGNAPFTITQTAGSNTNIPDRLTRSEITIIKKDSETGDRLAGAEFEVEGFVQGNNRRYKVTTDANGEAKIANVLPGTYEVTETKAPEGYDLLPNKLELVVNLGGTSENPPFEIENTKSAQYNVTYDANGADSATSDVPLDTLDYHHTDTVTVLETPENLRRVGYTFKGWTQKQDGTGTLLKETDTFEMPASNVTLYAQWDKVIYHVSYDANGADSTTSDVPSDPSNYYHKDTVTVLETPENLRRVGYTFRGWTQKQDGTGTLLKEADTFEMPASNVTLYAQWDKEIYHVTYDANGADTATSDVPTDVTDYHYKDTVTVLETPENLRRIGYTFSGWTQKQDGTGTLLKETDTFEMPASNVTLYAQWDKEVYHVTYDANGADSTTSDVPSDVTDYHHKDTVTVLETPENLRRVGYTFRGWTQKQDGTGTLLKEADTFEMPASNVTLYAQWDLIPTYVVTYDANGADSTTSDVPSDPSNYYHKDTVTVLETPENLRRVGYTFKGWTQKQDGTGTLLKETDTFEMPASNVTLYAQWDKEVYHVTYDANGADSATSDVPSDVTDYHHKDTVTVLETPENLRRVGYTFKGWTQKQDGTGTLLKETDTFEMPAEDVTLYAQWDKVIYHVSYDANGADTATSDVPSDVTDYHYTDTVTVLETPANLKRLGYTFKGWTQKQDGTGTLLKETDTFEMPAEDVTLYAQWDKVIYHVSYDANGADTATSDVPADVTDYHHKDIVTVLETPANLKRLGYTFKGWTQKQDGTGTLLKETDTFEMPASNVTLYAQWDKEVYHVTYDANGADSTTSDVPSDVTDYHHKDTVTVLETPENLRRVGYTFSGWTQKQDGTGRLLKETDTFEMPAEDVTLYAQWDKVIYHVSYDANGADTATSDVPSDVTDYHHKDTVTVLETPENLRRVGYTFSGWTQKQDGTGTLLKETDTFEMPAEDVTLYAQWDKEVYHVSYDANGADSTTSDVPADVTDYHHKDTVTVLETPENLRRVGYTFSGWTQKQDGTGTLLKETDTFEMPAEDVTLYAQWDKVIYHVSYDANGADSTTSDVPSDVTDYHHKDTVTVLETPENLRRVGYTFRGWTQKQDGTGRLLKETDTFEMPAEDVTLYAQWDKVIYHVSYDANGADTATSDVPSDVTDYHHKDTVTVLETPENLRRVGYTFSGWTQKQDGTGTLLKETDTFEMPAEDVTLYAQWDKEVYHVSYDANGADSTTSDVPADVTDYHHKDTVTVLETPENLRRVGYTFKGWTQKQDGTGTLLKETDTFEMPASNVTLYAQWDKVIYHVSYDANGADTATSDVPSDVTDYHHKDTVTVLETPENLKRAGYTFKGWTQKQDGTGRVLKEADTFEMPASNVTLYAQWIPFSTYVVTYDANGADTATSDVPSDPSNYYHKDTVTVLETPANLKRLGYTFKGWTQKQDGTGTLLKETDTFEMPASNVTLYAQWDKVIYHVTYDANGADSATSDVPSDVTDYHHKDTVTVLETPENLRRVGYTFKGWTQKQDGTGTLLKETDTFEMPAEDVTLYAQWDLIPTYVVTYDANGADTATSDVPSDASNYYHKDTVTVLETPENLRRVGYTFRGWTQKQDGTGTLLKETDTFEMPASNVTLYAQWDKEIYHVTYDANGADSATSDVPSDVTEYHHKDTVTVLETPENLRRVGYTFKGWTQKQDGTGRVLKEADTFEMPASNVTLYAQWDKVIYHVTYNANGADTATSDVPLDSSDYNYKSVVTVLETPENLKRLGYTFKGWTQKQDGTGTVLKETDTFEMPASNVTLYAQWTPDPVATYVVAYDGNGSDAGTPPVDAGQYVNGAQVSVLDNTNLALTGHTFAGWNTKADGSGTPYAVGDTFSMPSANVTLYAQWTPDSVTTYVVAYDGNGSDAGTPPVDAGQYVNGAQVSVLDNTNLALTGHTFAGWNTKADGSGTPYAAGDTFAMPSANVTLYAQWTPDPVATYVVAYDGNGSDAGTPPVDAGQYVSGAQVSVLDNTDLALTGHTFAGWNTEADGSGTPYAVGDTFSMPSANVTLYAQWTPDSVTTYVVAYDGNGSDAGTPPVDAGQYVSGAQVSVLDNTDLALTGHTFADWNTKADGSGTPYAAGDTFAMPSANVTLYAQWTPDPVATYVVAYDGNGSDAGTPPVDVGQYVSGAQVSVLDNTDLALTGHTFADWNTKADGSGTPYAAGDTFAMPSANVTLYAQWTPDPVATYVVAYDGNGSDAGTPPVDVGQYVSGAQVNVLDNTDLALTGHTFAGWNTKADGSGTPYAAGDTFAMPSANVTLYAQWTPAPILTYVVVYDDNGADAGMPPIDATLYVTGDEVSVLDNTDLGLTGHIFAGWNTKANGTGTSYTAGDTLIVETEDIILYAQWTPIAPVSFVVLYDGNGNTGGVVPVDTNTYLNGEKVKVLPGEPTKKGHKFLGWHYNGKTYKAGNTVKLQNENITFIAQWAEEENLPVTGENISERILTSSSLMLLGIISTTFILKRKK